MELAEYVKNYFRISAGTEQYQGKFLSRISVLVGRIGVMNVLLISVTERTVEIGIRKAVGANKRDIVWQFLSESVAISTFGSFLGLVVGILSTMVMAPVIHPAGVIFPPRHFGSCFFSSTDEVISTYSAAIWLFF